MNDKPPKDFQIGDVEDPRGSSAAGPDGDGADKPEIPVVRFRNRPQRQGSNKMTLLVGGAALVIIIILLLKLF